MLRCLHRVIPATALLLLTLSLAACSDDSAALAPDSGVLDSSTADRGPLLDSEQPTADAAADLVLLSEAGADLPGLPDGSGPVGDLALPPDAGSDSAPVGDLALPPDASELPDAQLVSDAAQGCAVWEITYDLTGSVFEISGTPLGAGNQANTVMEPYDADDHVGPGSFVLRFADVNGAPGGPATIYSYAVSLHFVVDSGFTLIETDAEAEAGPTDCGVTSGTLSGTTVAWDPAAIVDHHIQGQILCTGSLCSMGGLPDGTPVPMDETEDQPLSDFVFTSDFSSFSMAKTVVKQDQYSTFSWTYSGTEVSRQLISAPACLCP